MNLIAGQNNSGKSNVLRFLHGPFRGLLENARGGKGHVDLSPLDRHLPVGPALRFELAISAEESTGLRGEIGRSFELLSDAWDTLDRVLNGLADPSDGLVWVRYSDAGQLDADWLETAAARTAPEDWTLLSAALSNSSGALEHNATEVFRALFARVLPVREVALVPAIRAIGAGAERSTDDFSGAGLIHHLAILQNPGIQDLVHQRQQFASINAFVAAVTEIPDAQLEIPNLRDTLHVTLGSQTLPLENLGTGIHEVTMLAAWGTILEDQIVCIEEPELHLHPILQRKLVDYLIENTSNQYFISTHSAHLLDHAQSSVFHIRWDGRQSEIEHSIDPAQRIDLCADLGYRPSDLLQANCVIWVEGPTDRLYVRHWLATVEPDLVEGIHYSIMFYGGRLLAHVSVSDIEIDDFISLRRINPWLSIVIDSDRTRPEDQIGATKRRVVSEFGKGPGHAWVTKGREIENYLSTEVLSTSLTAAHPGATMISRRGALEYADVLKIRIDGRETEADKLKVAHHAITQPADLSILDLRTQIMKISRFVRAANGMPK